MHIELSVSGQRLRREMGPGIVGGSRYYLTAHVAFEGNDWEGCQVWPLCTRWMVRLKQTPSRDC